MSQSQFSGIAMLVALTFLVLAVASCSTPEQAPARAISQATNAPIEGTSEFHGAHIGGDGLRDQLPGE